jgi:prepilin-type N-terminal cleavage/methylation domain-containing protein
MYRKSSQAGFTLIEMIVSLGLFSVVVTVAVGALLVLVATNRQLQGEQSVMTNLAFALDSMTREIRTGTRYYCDSAGSTGGPNNIFNDANDIDVVLSGSSIRDCHNGNSGAQRYQGIAFIEAGDSISAASADRILYYYDRTNKKIYRRVGGGPSESIVSDGIVIENMEFYVTGSSLLSSGGTDQSAVTIFITASERGDTADKKYHIETTVTQRTIDI